MTPQARDSRWPVVGLNAERRRLLEALERRESLLLVGPPGCGKTTAIRWALDSDGRRGLYIPYTQVLHDLLVSLARALLEGGHPALLRLAAGAEPSKWAAKQTSVRLRGLLWSALEAEPRTIILDQVEGAGHGTLRFFERLFYGQGMAIIAAARDLRALGALIRLFWDPRTTIAFEPLTPVESMKLFNAAAQRFALQGLEIEEFREQVVESAAGNPGQIVEMCRLAADPRYRAGRRVKFAPLRIDVMIKFWR